MSESSDEVESVIDDIKVTVTIRGPGIVSVDPAELVRSRKVKEQFKAIESLAKKGAFD